MVWIDKTLEETKIKCSYYWNEKAICTYLSFLAIIDKKKSVMCFESYILYIPKRSRRK